MKNIYFVQPNNIVGTSAYLPYSVGEIAAYSWQFSEIQEEYCLAGLIFLKDQLDEVVQRLDKPFIVGFSNYIWNVEYNLHLAKAIKERWQDCIIIFGGPQIPNNTDYLTEYPYIDILIHSEGEEIFHDILSTYMIDCDLSKINNISYCENGNPVQTRQVSPGEIKDFPSPYTSGIFDSILADERYNGMQFDMIIETNRGCPYKCTYCCWGNNDSKLRFFSMERVKSELEWLTQHKIAFCFCADANFGICKRDEDIVDLLVELKKESGYPERFECISEKEKDDALFRINQKLHSVNLNRAVSFACQSMSPTVLKNIGRKNMSIERFSEQLKLYHNAGMNTYTDLIIGLPGETYESFCRGMFSVIEAGQHTSLNTFCCEMLVNSALNSPEYIEKHKIKTVKSDIVMNHSRVEKSDAFGSKSEIIVETDTMSREDWKRIIRISTVVQSFHYMGLLRFIAIYLRKARNISYYDFYTTFFERVANKNGLILSIINQVTGCVDSFLEGKSRLCYSNEKFGNIYFPFEDGVFLCCVDEIDAFYAEVSEHVRCFFDDEVLFSDLLKYQKGIINKIGDRVRTLDTEYDWHGYFADIYDTSAKEPHKEKTRLQLSPTSIDNPGEYARQIVWYGKRSDKMIIDGIVTDE